MKELYLPRGSDGFARSRDVVRGPRSPRGLASPGRWHWLALKLGKPRCLLEPPLIRAQKELDSVSGFQPKGSALRATNKTLQGGAPCPRAVVARDICLSPGAVDLLSELTCTLDSREGRVGRGRHRPLVRRWLSLPGLWPEEEKRSIVKTPSAASVGEKLTVHAAFGRTFLVLKCNFRPHCL